MVKAKLINAQEVAEQLGVSKAYAYKLIRRLNGELEERGCLVIPGKVSIEFFEGRFFPKAQEAGKGGYRVHE